MRKYCDICVLLLASDGTGPGCYLRLKSTAKNAHVEGDFTLPAKNTVLFVIGLFLL